MYIFTDEDIDWLRRPHIARAWFADIDLPSGRWYLHNGYGRAVIDGIEWRGVSNPAGGQLVSISSVEEPRFGQAAKVDIALSGVSRDFLISVHEQALAIEGRACSIGWCLFDQETQDVWPGGMKWLFRDGQLSSPKIHFAGIGQRMVLISVESYWHTMNFPFGGRWTPADQRRRFPFDKGLDLIGVKVNEVIKR